MFALGGSERDKEEESKEKHFFPKGSSKYYES
jgi:hypothetical protein